MNGNDAVDLRNRTVLIADDDDVTRGLLRSLLRVSGLQVIAECANGERALAEYRRLRPEIVCLDIDMPGVDGLAALSQIRGLSSETVIIMISGETSEGNTRKAIEAKADGVIAKPFTTARVTGAIERGLRQRRKTPPTASI